MDSDYEDRMIRATDALRRMNPRAFETRMKPDWPTRRERQHLHARGYRSRVRLNWTDDEQFMPHPPPNIRHFTLGADR
jgi:hypothetical protein